MSGGRFSGGWVLHRLSDIAFLRNERVETLGLPLAKHGVDLEDIEPVTGRVLKFRDLREKTAQKTIFRKGDVLFGRLRSYLRKYWVADVDGVCSTEIWVIVAKTSVVSLEFLAAVIKSDRFVAATSVSTGTHMPRSEWAITREASFDLPSDVAEQNAIAAALSDAEALTAELEDILRLKRAVLSAATEELMSGRVRLPGFGEPSLHKRRVKDLGEIFKGKGVSKKDIRLRGHPCIRYADIYTLHGTLASSEKRVSSETYALATPLTRGDIVMAASGENETQIGKATLCDMDGACAGSDSIVLRPLGVDPLYLCFLLNSPQARRLKAKASHGEVIVHLRKDALADLELLLHQNLDEQKAIAAALFDMEAEVHALADKAAKIRALKVAMADELLAGRTRLLVEAG